MIRMVMGIVIPHEETFEIFTHEFSGLVSYQAVVGGYIEPIRIEAPAMTLFANEEGKVQNLPVNRRATCLWWLLSPAVRDYDVLVGDVALVGSMPNGTESDVPSDLVELITNAGAYEIEVQTVSDTAWLGNGDRFSDYFEAAFYAVHLAGRWTQIRNVRVVRAD